MTRRQRPPSVCDDCQADIHRPLSGTRRDIIVNADNRRVELHRRTCLCGCACQAGTLTVHPAPDYFDSPDPPPDNEATPIETTLILTADQLRFADDRPTQLLHLDPRELDRLTTRHTDPPDNTKPPDPPPPHGPHNRDPDDPLR